MPLLPTSRRTWLKTGLACAAAGLGATLTALADNRTVKILVGFPPAVVRTPSRACWPSRCARRWAPR